MGGEPPPFCLRPLSVCVKKRRHIKNDEPCVEGRKTLRNTTKHRPTLEGGTNRDGGVGGGGATAEQMASRREEPRRTLDVEGQRPQTLTEWILLQHSTSPRAESTNQYKQCSESPQKGPQKNQSGPRLPEEGERVCSEALFSGVTSSEAPLAFCQTDLVPTTSVSRRVEAPHPIVWCVRHKGWVRLSSPPLSLHNEGKDLLL